MVITNKKRAAGLKRLFFLIGLAMAVFMLIMFVKDRIGTILLTAGAFVVWFFIFQFFDFLYVEFSDDNDKILLRYYPAVKFGKKDYNEIEFPQKMLHDARFETSLFGLITDLMLVVKTKRGVAEYPSVSLSAVKAADRKKIEEALYRILEK